MAVVEAVDTGAAVVVDMGAAVMAAAVMAVPLTDADTAAAAMGAQELAAAALEAAADAEAAAVVVYGLEAFGSVDSGSLNGLAAEAPLIGFATVELPRLAYTAEKLTRCVQVRFYQSVARG